LCCPLLFFTELHQYHCRQLLNILLAGWTCCKDHWTLHSSYCYGRDDIERNTSQSCH
jgi:hypothetical protein